MTEPYGPEALAAFNQANALFKAGEYEQALAVEMKPSDRGLIEKRIAVQRAAACKSGSTVSRDALPGGGAPSANSNEENK